MQLSDWHMWFKRRGGRQLRDLVMDRWDPIGVRGIPEAYDEYDRYLGGIADALRRDVGEQGIADLLSGLAGANMGLQADRDRDLAAARAITLWYGAAMATEHGAGSDGDSGDIRGR